MYAKKNSRKAIVLLLVLVLLLGCTVGATLAWLADKTDPIVNTFTTSNVSITLTETAPANKTAKMIPGTTIPKDPKVTVSADSEDCYVFVKVEAKNGVVLQSASTASDYITYAIKAGWTELEAGTGIYYIEAKAGDVIEILANNQVQVLPTVTKAMMTAAETNVPKLTFTAYAIQKVKGEGTFTPAEAWAAINS